MNDWLLFQFAIDVTLFAIVILFIVRDGKSRAQREAEPVQTKETAPMVVDTEQINALMDELAKLVMRAEKVADRIERAVRNNPPVADEKPVRPKQPPPVSPKLPPVKELEQTSAEITTAILDEEPYAKAAKLIKKGLADDEIGRRVGLPPHEVKLIRQMAN